MSKPEHLARRKTSALLDSVMQIATGGRGPGAIPAEKATQLVIDSAADFADSDVSASAAATVQEWAATAADELGEGEGMADRLVGMLVGIADEDGEGAPEGAAEEVATMALDAAWSYMAENGASEEDLGALFGDDPEAADLAAVRVSEMLLDSLPEGQEAAFDSVNDFAFKPRGNGLLDAVYKKARVVRGGRVAVIKKRIAGVVRRSAAQKMAIKKARMKSHGAMATMHRAKSMRVRTSRGL